MCPGSKQQAQYCPSLLTVSKCSTRTPASQSGRPGRGRSTNPDTRGTEPIRRRAGGAGGPAANVTSVDIKIPVKRGRPGSQQTPNPTMGPKVHNRYPVYPTQKMCTHYMFYLDALGKLNSDAHHPGVTLKKYTMK